MRLPDEFLFEYKPKLIPPQWFCHGFINKIPQLRFGKDYGDDISHDWLARYEATMHLLIGFAEASPRIDYNSPRLSFLTPDNIETLQSCLFPVYYSLKTGKVYLGRVSKGYTSIVHTFRNTFTAPILYTFKADVITKSFIVDSCDQEIDLEQLKLKTNSKKLPCKVLAWLYHDADTSEYLRVSHKSYLPDDATLLVVCGRRIVIANKLEINNLIAQDKIDLLLDHKNNQPNMQIVYIGDTGDQPERISYIPGKGIACDYTGLDYLYFKGTQDVTPNVATGTDLVKNLACKAPHNIACYTYLDFRDNTVMSEYDFELNATYDCGHNLVSLKLPRIWQTLDLYHLVFHPSGNTGKSHLSELVLPEEITDVPELNYFPIKKLVIPKKVMEFYLLELATPALEELVLLCDDLIIIEFEYITNVKKLQCSMHVLHQLADRDSGFLHWFPDLKTINDQPVVPYLTNISAYRLLCGLSVINIE